MSKSILPYDVRLFDRIDEPTLSLRTVLENREQAKDVILGKTINGKALKPLYVVEDERLEKSTLKALAPWLSPLEVFSQRVSQWSIVLFDDSLSTSAWEVIERLWSKNESLAWSVLYAEYAMRRTHGSLDQMSMFTVASSIKRQYQLALRSQSLFAAVLESYHHFRLQLVRQDFFPSHAHLTLAIYLRPSIYADAGKAWILHRVEAPGERNQLLFHMFEGRIRVLTNVVGSPITQATTIFAVNHDTDKLEKIDSLAAPTSLLRPFDIEVNIGVDDDDSLYVDSIRTGLQLSTALIESESVGALKVHVIKDELYDMSKTRDSDRRSFVESHIRGNVKRHVFAGYVPESVSRDGVKLSKIGPSVLSLDDDDTEQDDEESPLYRIDLQRVMGAHLVFKASASERTVVLETTQPHDRDTLRRRTWLTQQTPNLFSSLFFLYGECPAVLYRRDDVQSLPENSDQGSIGVGTELLRHTESVWTREAEDDDEEDAYLQYDSASLRKAKYRNARLERYLVGAHSTLLNNFQVAKPSSLVAAYPVDVRLAFGPQQSTTPTLFGFYMPPFAGVDLQRERIAARTMLIVQDPDKNLYRNRVELFRVVVFLDWRSRMVSKKGYRQQAPVQFTYQLHYAADGTLEAVLLVPKDYARNSRVFPFEFFWYRPGGDNSIEEAVTKLAGEEVAPVLS